MRADEFACAATALMLSLNLRTASPSSTLMRGLLRTRSSSSALRTTGMRWIVKLSAPTSVTIAFVTYAFIPWMSETTAMIDVTATMFPRTVRNDRSLFVQMAFSAMPTASRNWFMPEGPALLLGRAGRDRGACSTLTAAPSFSSRTDANGPTTTLSPSFSPPRTSKYLSPAMPGLDRHELRLVVADDEDALELLPRLPGLELRRLHRAGPWALRRVGLGIPDDVALFVHDHFADGRRLDRHGDHVLARRGRDLGGARESGPDFGNLRVERDVDLEVRRL